MCSFIFEFIKKHKLGKKIKWDAFPGILLLFRNKNIFGCKIVKNGKSSYY